MMTDAYVGKFKNHDIRYIVENKELWFSCRDISIALGLSPCVINDYAKHYLRDSEIIRLPAFLVTGTKGGKPMVFINKSGLYKTFDQITKDCDKDAFKKWVETEVLSDVYQKQPEENKAACAETLRNSLFKTSVELYNSAIPVVKEVFEKMSYGRDRERVLIALVNMERAIKELNLLAQHKD